MTAFAPLVSFSASPVQPLLLQSKPSKVVSMLFDSHVPGVALPVAAARRVKLDRQAVGGLADIDTALTHVDAQKRTWLDRLSGQASACLPR